MVQANSASNSVKNISFYLQLAAGGNAVDITKVGYTISTPKMVKTVQGTDSTVVNITWLKIISPGNLLEPREMVLIDLGTEDMGFAVGTMAVNDRITVEVKPPIGSSLPITRTLPAALNSPRWYEVY
jgi:flagellin FlaB